MVVRYHRYIAELWDDLDLGELVGDLSDFLLQSGFGTEEGEYDEDQLQALHDAILEAMMRRGLLSDEDMQKLIDDADALRSPDKVVSAGARRSSHVRGGPSTTHPGRAASARGPPTV